MLSIPHMIVVFIVVLVVFGPQKLPELARGLGKLMAEFRKASMDFKSAFEEEMRDLERQAMMAERKKAAEAAAASAAVQPVQPAALPDSTATETSAGSEAGATEPPASSQATEAPSNGTTFDTQAAEAPVVVSVAESVARGSGDLAENKAETATADLQESSQDAQHSA